MSQSKVTCNVLLPGVMFPACVHEGVSILEAARRTAVTHCQTHGVEGTYRVLVEYEHRGRLIADSVQVRVELKATVVKS